MILITGATGMVGAHLALHLLESRDNVRAICRKSASADKTRRLFGLYGKEDFFDRIEWVTADITDIPSLEAAFDHVTKVYHCAASLSFDPADEEILRKTNIEGTANIVNFCLAKGVEKLCFISSIAALGDLRPGESIVTEETEWNPESPHSDYAISKHGAEMEVWRGHQEGLKIVIINPGVILGPAADIAGWKSGSPEIFNRVANGLRFYTRGTTGFVAVNDVVRIMRLLMESDINGERFIVTAENISFETMLKWIAIALHVKGPNLSGKPWITSIAWRLDWLAGLFGNSRKLSRDMAGSLHNTEPYSNEKVMMMPGYSFADIRESVKRIAAFYPK